MSLLNVKGAGDDLQFKCSRNTASCQ